MDCEKFDRIVLDLLYDELDELTSAAARRHMEHCTRCRAIGSSLRATREVGARPLAEPPAALELRILEAERHATRQLPLGKRLGRGLSLVAGYAMRPQLSMAALLMLMIGSSLFFLRAQPGDREHVLVTERGVPESDNDSVAVVSRKGAPEPEAARPTTAPRAAARSNEALVARERPPEPRAALAPLEPVPAPKAAGVADARGGGVANLDSNDKPGEDPAAGNVSDSDASYDAAMAAYRDSRYSEAERRFGELANQGGAHAPSAALYEAQALRMVSGCPSAAPRFEDVHTRYPGPVGNSAAWQAADCYRSLGELAQARQTYVMLSADPSYKARAAEALAELDQQSSDQATAVRKTKAAPSTPSKPASAAPAAKPAPATAASPSP